MKDQNYEICAMVASLDEMLVRILNAIEEARDSNNYNNNILF